MHEEIVDAEKSDSEQSKTGDHEMENGQQPQVLSVAFALVFKHDFRRQRGYDGWRPVCDRTDNEVNQSKEANSYERQDKEQTQNQNNFAPADVQKGKTEVGIHKMKKPVSSSDWI